MRVATTFVVSINVCFGLQGPEGPPGVSGPTGRPVCTEMFTVSVIRRCFVREYHVPKQCFDRRILISFAFAAVKVDRVQLISNCYVITYMCRLIIHRGGARPVNEDADV